MARTIRWTIPFKSLNGTNCRIDIYDEGWSGGATELSPNNVNAPGYAADDPFYFEETFSNDLLSDVVRYKTGYIRMVELQKDSLSVLYPTSKFQRYVEFYYGSVMRFKGYMQVQDFSNPWEPSPRVIEFPVVSPLGLAEEVNFGIIYPPHSVTIGSLIDEIIAGLRVSYSYVSFPALSDADLSKTVYSLFVSPWNDEYHSSIRSASPSVFIAPRSYMTLLDALCKAYGWILHDTPNELIFSMFDHRGKYWQYPVGHVGDPSYRSQSQAPTDQTFPLTNWFSECDANAQISSILPANGVQMNYEGESLDDLEPTLDRAQFYSVTGYGDTESVNVCNLTPITSEWTGMAGEVTFDANHRVDSYGAHSIVYKDQKGILWKIDQSWVSGNVIFSTRFYTPTLGKLWHCDFTVQVGDFMPSLKTDEDLKEYNVRAETDCTNPDYIDVHFKINYSQSMPLPENDILFITDIKLEYIDSGKPYAKYAMTPAKDYEILSDTGNKSNPVGVDMPLTIYRLGQTMIGTSVVANKLTTYSYMQRPRLELVEKFRGTSLPDKYYGMLFSFDSRLWRIIGVAYEPWNDIYKLTIESSDIFN